MALVAYSDSEASDTEEGSKPVAPRVTKPSTKSAFQKTESRKIKVDLPSAQPDATAQDEQPPAKRAKTAGGFGGFNSLLPAPKRPAAQSGPKPGLSLKTSSEAAFSRESPAMPACRESADESNADEVTGKAEEKPTVTKLVGNATRFKPLSVGYPKKKKKAVKEVMAQKPVAADVEKKLEPVVFPAHKVVPPKKEKRNLFSVQQDDEQPAPIMASSSYEFLTVPEHIPPPNMEPEVMGPQPSIPAQPNSLEAIASDLNLTPAQRRHLFGRSSKGAPINVNISHLNIDSEYAANEQLRQNGEAFEHKAVKSIAPGKHSLQQLVNNARSNQDSIEEKWAEGKAKRGGGGGGIGK